LLLKPAPKVLIPLRGRLVFMRGDAAVTQRAQERLHEPPFVAGGFRTSDKQDVTRRFAIGLVYPETS
jgi:hypothetical protein